jgi:hypothetical protein
LGLFEFFKSASFEGGEFLYSVDQYVQRHGDGMFLASFSGFTCQSFKLSHICTEINQIFRSKVFEGQPLTLPQSTKCMDIQSALKALDYHTLELFAHQGRPERLQLLIVILPEEKGHYGM